MSGWIPTTKATASNPPVTKMKDEKLDVLALVERLNGLLDRYTELYNIYQKMQFINSSPSKEHLERVLAYTEKAIEAICLRLATQQIIVDT